MKKSFLNSDEIEPITAESEIDKSESRQFSQKDSLILLAGSLVYFGWFYFIVGIHSEHIGMYALALFLYFVHGKTRQFIIAFSIFIFYWIVYDSMRVLPNYWSQCQTNIYQKHIFQKYG